MAAPLIIADKLVEKFISDIGPIAVCEPFRLELKRRIAAAMREFAIEKLRESIGANRRRNAAITIAGQSLRDIGAPDIADECSRLARSLDFCAAEAEYIIREMG